MQIEKALVELRSNCAYLRPEAEIPALRIENELVAAQFEPVCLLN